MLDSSVAAVDSSAAARMRPLVRLLEAVVFGAGLVTLFAAWRPAFAFFAGGIVLFCAVVGFDFNLATAAIPPNPSSESESTKRSK